MSKDTALPAEGPACPGKNPQQEKIHLLSNSNDACDNESSTSNTSRTSSREPFAEGPCQMTGENSAFYDPVQTQPQALPQPAPSAQGGALAVGDTARSLACPANPTAVLSHANGVLRPGSSGVRAAHPCSCGAGVVQGTGSGTAQQPRKQSPPVAQKMRSKLRSSLSVDSDGSRRSKGSSQGLHKAHTLPEDCCVHCILACLFCEFLTLCNMVVAQASCGTCTPEVCCCCCTDDMGDDCSSPCDMDCGIMDACCESSDCLEICMECCGICFPT